MSNNDDPHAQAETPDMQWPTEADITSARAQAQHKAAVRVARMEKPLLCLEEVKAALYLLAIDPAQGLFLAPLARSALVCLEPAAVPLCEISPYYLTVGLLEFVGKVDGPIESEGGFPEHVIQLARSASFHLNYQLCLEVENAKKEN